MPSCQVEDIVDTGRTLKSLISSIQEQGAASIKIATLLNKQARRVVDVQADYIGFEVYSLPLHVTPDWYTSMVDVQLVYIMLR